MKLRKEDKQKCDNEGRQNEPKPTKYDSRNGKSPTRSVPRFSLYPVEPDDAQGKGPHGKNNRKEGKNPHCEAQHSKNHT